MSAEATRIVIAAILMSAACERDRAREYELRGHVLAVDQARQEVTIKHEDIPRFMPGMTMAFKVADGKLLDGRVAGDLVKATLVVSDTAVHLRTLERTGFSALDGPPDLPMVVLTVGERVADASFVDETGTTRRFGDWRGQIVAVTFMYTRCPVATFCPVMDRHFKAVQDGIRSDPSLGGARLVSVSIDSEHDTPAILLQHARKLQADPSVWRFLTGAADEIARFARQFGLSITADTASAPEIVHNLRTAVVDPEGRLVAVLNGSDWTPSELLKRLRDVSARRPADQE